MEGGTERYPILFSMSPCRYISSCRATTHLWWISKGRARWPRSATYARVRGGRRILRIKNDKPRTESPLAQAEEPAPRAFSTISRAASRSSEVSRMRVRGSLRPPDDGEVARCKFVPRESLRLLIGDPRGPRPDPSAAPSTGSPPKGGEGSATLGGGVKENRSWKAARLSKWLLRSVARTRAMRIRLKRSRSSLKSEPRRAGWLPCAVVRTVQPSER